MARIIARRLCQNSPSLQPRDAWAKGNLPAEALRQREPSGHPAFLCASAALRFVSLRLQLREQNHVANAFLAEEHHAQTVNADADAAGGRHAMFERDEEILVQFLLLAAGLVFQCGPLLNRVVLLGVAGG